MKQLQEFSVQEEGTLLNAIEKIELNHSRAVVVLRQKIAVGVISEGDIMRALLNGMDIHTPLRGFVHGSFRYLHKLDKKKAFELFRKHAITLIPIVDNKFILVDVIALKDLIQELGFL